MAEYSNMIDRSDANALMPEDVAKTITQAIERKSYFLQLATRLPDMPRKMRRMPVLSVLPTAYFVNGDTGLKQTTEVNWTNRYITAEEIAVVVPIPNAVLADTDYDIWGEISPHIQTAFGQLIDRTVAYGGMVGFDKPSSDWPDGVAKGATDAGALVSLAEVGDMYDALLGEGGVASKVEESGFSVTGHLGSPSVRAKLRGTRDADGNPIFSKNGASGYDLDGAQILFPDNGSLNASKSLVISGDFGQMVYAVRQDITYTITTNGVISDNSGAIIYNLFQQDMTAMKVVMRMGWQLPNAPNWLKPTLADASRYPFGVLTA